jgi:hypothetical protein
VLEIVDRREYGGHDQQAQEGRGQHSSDDRDGHWLVKTRIRADGSVSTLHHSQGRLHSTLCNPIDLTGRAVTAKP